MGDIIILGQGSYGTIVLFKDAPDIVVKIHELSSDEIANANVLSKDLNSTDKRHLCEELFKTEFNYHMKLYSIRQYVDVIIPRPIEYEYITRTESDSACTYKMQKLEYPSIAALQKMILPSRLKLFEKTNPAIHAPPYLFFSAFSDDYQNGIVQLSDMVGVSIYNQLYYTVNNRTIFDIAESVIDCFFQLTYRAKIILQDIEFLLTSNEKTKPVAGIIDFNQVVSFEDRQSAVRNRVGPEYSIEYDIANTYLFLSGIDTGFFMTDRNTNWKFLPTPHILPHVFFTEIHKTRQKISLQDISSYLSTIRHICNKIFEIEYDRYTKTHVDNHDKFDKLCDKIMVWHEIQIFGMLTDDEPLDIVVKMAEREHKFTYKVADVNDITHTAKSYVHFSPAPVITQTDLDADYTYFMLISDPHIENNLHFARFRQSQKRGEMTENLIYEKYPILWFDIMFQRLFLIKCLSAKIDKMNEVQLDAIAHMLSTNQNIDRILDAILQRKKHTKTIRHKTSLSNVHTPHNRTRRVTQRTGGKKRNKNNT